MVIFHSYVSHYQRVIGFPVIPEWLVTSRIPSRWSRLWKMLGLEAAQENHAKDQDSEDLLRLMRTRRCHVTFSSNQKKIVSCFFLKKSANHRVISPQNHPWIPEMSFLLDQFWRETIHHPFLRKLLPSKCHPIPSHYTGSSIGITIIGYNYPDYP